VRQSLITPKIRSIGLWLLDNAVRFKGSHVVPKMLIISPDIILRNPKKRLLAGICFLRVARWASTKARWKFITETHGLPDKIDY
jgi:hypothetical protein